MNHVYGSIYTFTRSISSCVGSRSRQSPRPIHGRDDVNRSLWVILEGMVLFFAHFDGGLIVGQMFEIPGAGGSQTALVRAFVRRRPRVQFPPAAL